jgi:hypothetical protein
MARARSWPNKASKNIKALGLTQLRPLVSRPDRAGGWIAGKSQNESTAISESTRGSAGWGAANCQSPKRVDLIHRIDQAGAAFRSLGDPLFGTSTTQGRLLVTMLAAIACEGRHGCTTNTSPSTRPISSARDYEHPLELTAHGAPQGGHSGTKVANLLTWPS